MNSNTEPNLSDEALSEMLAKPTNNSADTEVVALKAALRSYRTETLAWAERRSATQPSLTSRAKEGRWAAVPQWSLACVAVVAVAAGVVHFAGYGAEDISPAANIAVTTSATTTASQDDIEADNQLLGSIDQALRYHSVSPADEFQAQPAKQSSRNTHTGVTD
jgi:hypothetical protein